MHTRICDEAEAFQSKSKHQDAIALLREKLDLTIRELGSDHPLTINDQESLSDSLSEVGSFAEAVTLDRKTLRARKKLDKRASSTLATQDSLAWNLAQIQQYTEAITLYRENLTVREQILGKTHDKTLETRQGLASCLHDIGAFGEAKELNGEVLRAREPQKRPDDYDLIACRHNMATNYLGLGEVEQAVIMTRQT